MIQIGGRHVVPEHVVAVHVVKHKEGWRRHSWQVEVLLVSGEKILDWGRGGDDIRAAEQSARWLAGHVDQAKMPPEMKPTPPPDLAPNLGRLLCAGTKIDTIKLLREATGCGLKEAKDFADLFR